jgi:hypothetical protein
VVSPLRGFPIIISRLIVGEIHVDSPPIFLIDPRKSVVRSTPFPISVVSVDRW